jgi:hypothetical protein
MNRKLVVSVGFGLVLWMQWEIGHAQTLSKKIPAGATYGEVLSLWGEPSDKVEKEVKGQVVWYYPDGAKVVFKEGKVRSWRPTKALLAQQNDQQVSKIPPTPAVLSGETRDLVRDIAKEVPSGPDVPMPDAPPAGMGHGAPPLIANSVPPGGRGAPPGLIPGEVMLDEEDEE